MLSDTGEAVIMNRTRFPAGRWGTPDLAWPATDEASSWITGRVIFSRST
jgi:hypothetical protein